MLREEVQMREREVQSDLSGGLNWPNQAAGLILKVTVSTGPEEEMQ